MADLLSPIMSPTSQGPACFSFYYHMFGPSIGNLSVLTSIAGHTSTRWMRSGTQGNKWQQVHLTISSSTDYRVSGWGCRWKAGRVAGWQYNGWACTDNDGYVRRLIAESAKC